MNLQKCYASIKGMYDYAVQLEKENKVLSTKVSNLEAELRAYRDNKDNLERVVESDKTLIQDYERKIESLTRDMDSLKSKLEFVKSGKEINPVSTVGSDSNSVSSGHKEYRSYRTSNGKIRRYEKVEEKNQDGIILVRWALVD